MTTMPAQVSEDHLCEKPPSRKVDRYPYGWREVRRILPDGQDTWERVPLTLSDVLHPQVEDFHMHSDEHERFCTYLHNVLEARLANTAGAVVLHDTRVAWDDPDLEAHGPDIAVIFNVRQRRNWSTFDVAEEGTRPSLIIEITSPRTRSLDLIDKVDEYDRAGVPFYAIVDTVVRRGQKTRRLLGYQLTPDGYVSLRPDEHGRLWLEPVSLWLGLENDALALYDRAGNSMANYTGLAAALEKVRSDAAEEARARAEAEARLAEAEARLRELEAELRARAGST